MAERTCMSVGMRSSTGSLSRLAHVVTESANDVSRPNESGEYLRTTTCRGVVEYAETNRPSPEPIARAPSRGDAAVPLSPPRDVQVAAPPCSIRSAPIRAVRARRRGPNGRGVTLRRSCCRPSLATPPRRPPPAPAHSPPDARQRWYGISRRTASATAARRHAMHARPH